MKKNDVWQKFDDEYLKPFEKRGGSPTKYGPGAIVFNYLHIREVAIEAFERGKKAKDNAND